MAISPSTPAPDFTLKTQDEKDWTLSDHRGNRVILLWYPLDWSPTCEAEHCRISDGSEELTSDADTVVVGISRDSTWSHKAWKEAKGISHDLLADVKLEVTKKYDLVHPNAPFISHRATVIVDRKGTVAWVDVQENTGEQRDWNRVREALKNIG